MTTPYILIDTPKADWVAFLKRTMLHCDGPNDRTRLHNLLKFGLEPNYWNEFVFKAYHHHQQDAVFLTGIPDIESSLPHALNGMIFIHHGDESVFEATRVTERPVRKKK